jgi:uncharacterized protein YgbK (DUF1537 family)
MKIGVLADDLTGAGDVAVALERAGFRTEIALWPPSSSGPKDRVWILSTESRGLTGAAAARRVRRSTRALKRWKAAFIFKKIDSTLRGPVGPEAVAFADALGLSPSTLPFVPAFPSAGRTVTNGRLLVDGTSLSRTAFGRDPRHPAPGGRVRDAAGDDFWIPDVPDEAALRHVAREVLRRGAHAAVGSAGFLAALLRAGLGADDRLVSRAGARSRRAAIHGLSTRRAKARASMPTVPTREDPPVMIVSGSAHPTARRQARTVVPSEETILVSAPATRGDPRAVVRMLVRRAVATARRRGITRFAVTGGETSVVLARALGVRGWRPVGVVDQGIPLMRSVGATENTFWVTKPGGFGREDVWTKAVTMLKKIR